MPLCFQNSTSLFHWPVIELNRVLTRLDVPHNINECVIERFLAELEWCGWRGGEPVYWLMVARLTEMTLLCAGSYADNCEFSAAGDLLVNPRKIVVREENGKSWVKKRHSRLSDNLRPQRMVPGYPGCRFFMPKYSLETVKPALLPYLFDQLKSSRCITPAYLDSVQGRMCKIADTIGFLSAGSLTTMEELYDHIHNGSPENKVFINANLCRFDTLTYACLGEEIESAGDPAFESRFIVPGPFSGAG